MKVVIAGLVSLLITLLFLTSCSYDNQEGIHPEYSCDTTGTITFQTLVPIFTTSCGATQNSCHGTNSVEYHLNDYTEAKDAADNGNLLGSILHDPNYTPMPDGGGFLDKCSINKIQAWINRGTPQ